MARPILIAEACYVLLRPDLETLVTMNFLRGFRAGRFRRTGQNFSTRIAARFRCTTVNGSCANEGAGSIVLLVV